MYRREYNQEIKAAQNVHRQPPKRILFYDPVNFHIVRKIPQMAYFQECEFNNCAMSFNRSDLTISDAVLFHWLSGAYRTLSDYRRPQDQVWVLVQHERTSAFKLVGGSSVLESMKGIFNWTMSYSKHSDIHLPYGVLKHNDETRPKRDYEKLAQRKFKDAIWVTSNCHTEGKREKYVKILKEYISIDILGSCGQKWNCGRRLDHDLDDCFDVLNTSYRYYLAFEKAFCEEYISEKFFENYKYDILQVVRGGVPGSRPINISHKAYISTSDFENAHELGKYLKNLSKDIKKYAKRLEEKDKYYPVHYRELFKQSMCEVCKRLNDVEKYRYVYKDMYDWMESMYPCFTPKDL